MNQAATVNKVVNEEVAETMYYATSEKMDLLMGEVVRWGTAGLVDEIVLAAVGEVVK